ncbi:hypothetical protein, partial [Lacticaseibacillus sp. 53-4]|uniref:hypothetical protein n=1 Tax=Lacticaseibacillus sp. 53-4 TaxID=2799575 RepID=UPI0019406FC6
RLETQPATGAYSPRENHPFDGWFLLACQADIVPASLAVTFNDKPKIDDPPFGVFTLAAGF